MSTFTRAQALGAAAALGVTAPLLTYCAARRRSRRWRRPQIPRSRTRCSNGPRSKPILTRRASGVLSASVSAVLNGFLADHNAHRDALIAVFTTAGQTAPDDIAPLDTPTLRTEADILSFAYTVERMLADAHLSAGPPVQESRLRQDCGVDPRRRNDSRGLAGRSPAAQSRLPVELRGGVTRGLPIY